MPFCREMRSSRTAGVALAVPLSAHPVARACAEMATDRLPRHVGAAEGSGRTGLCLHDWGAVADDRQAPEGSFPRTVQVRLTGRTRCRLPA
jgi:hypothetical protein